MSAVDHDLERVTPAVRALGTHALVPRDGLFDLLRRARRVTLVSAPAGSGKTSVLRSWVVEAGVTESTAWVSVGAGERDPQRFWLSVLDAVGGTKAGSVVVRELTPAPDLDGGAIAERLLVDLSGLAERIWLVIDDLHELCSGECASPARAAVDAVPG